MKRKTVTMPVIHKTKTGKKYFIVNDQRVYIESGMSKKDISSIYKLLKKKLQNKQKITNSAKAIVNINNPAPIKRRRRNNKKKAFESTLNDFNRVTTSSGNNNEDKVNYLINKNHSLNQRLNEIDYSDGGRYLMMMKDPEFQKISQIRY